MCFLCICRKAIVVGLNGRRERRGIHSCVGFVYCFKSRVSLAKPAYFILEMASSGATRMAEFCVGLRGLCHVYGAIYFVGLFEKVRFLVMKKRK